eukprot:g4772.t1
MVWTYPPMSMTYLALGLAATFVDESDEDALRAFTILIEGAILGIFSGSLFVLIVLLKAGPINTLFQNAFRSVFAQTWDEYVITRPAAQEKHAESSLPHSPPPWMTADWRTNFWSYFERFYDAEEYVITRPAAQEQHAHAEFSNFGMWRTNFWSYVERFYDGEKQLYCDQNPDLVEGAGIQRSRSIHRLLDAEAQGDARAERRFLKYVLAKCYPERNEDDPDEAHSVRFRGDNCEMVQLRFTDAGGEPILPGADPYAIDGLDECALLEHEYWTCCPEAVDKSLQKGSVGEYFSRKLFWFPGVGMCQGLLLRVSPYMQPEEAQVAFDIYDRWALSSYGFVDDGDFIAPDEEKSRLESHLRRYYPTGQGIVTAGKLNIENHLRFWASLKTPAERFLVGLLNEQFGPLSEEEFRANGALLTELRAELPSEFLAAQYAGIPAFHSCVTCDWADENSEDGSVSPGFYQTTTFLFLLTSLVKVFFITPSRAPAEILTSKITADVAVKRSAELRAEADARTGEVIEQVAGGKQAVPHFSLSGLVDAHTGTTSQFGSYYSTDFEVHRNWLAITSMLPLKAWYWEKTSEWTLDYPPAFAYFESGVAAVMKGLCSVLGSDGNFCSRSLLPALEVENQNFNSFGFYAFHRLTVIFTDLFLVFAVRKWLAGSTSQRHLLRVPFATFFVVMNAGLLIVDHMHFQYNGLLLGLLFLSAHRISKGNNRQGAAIFTVIFNMKHIFLYVAPVFFLVLLERECFVVEGGGSKSYRGRNEGSSSSAGPPEDAGGKGRKNVEKKPRARFSLFRFLRLGVLVLATTALVWVPVTLYPALERQLEGIAAVKQSTINLPWALRWVLSGGKAAEVIEPRVLAAWLALSEHPIH